MLTVFHQHGAHISIPVSMLTHFDSLLALHLLKAHFHSNLFSISTEMTCEDAAAYIRCRSPTQSM